MLFTLNRQSLIKNRQFKKMANILIIDDEQPICMAMVSAIGKMGHHVEYVLTLKEGLSKVSSEQFDVVFLDVRLPDGNGLEALPVIRQGSMPPEVIIITAEGEPAGAELAIKSGAWDYIEKPPSLTSMMLPLKRALQYREEKKSKISAVALKREGIIGDSQQIKDCLDIIAHGAGSNANILISGETGTGKELFARSIHMNSPRSMKAFVVVDCGALPETLVESTLFGHEKGAFTGAEKDKMGLIKQADGGTLFLDEVGELSMTIQKAFLRVLQEKQFRPVGSRKEVQSDFRLLAATNRDLNRLAESGKFRQDLLYRIRSIYLELPPLREHPEDILKLALFHAARICDEYGIGTKGFSPEFIKALNTYHWPGNVRELVNSLESAIADAGDKPTLFAKHLPNHIRIKIASDSLKKKKARKASDKKDQTPSKSLPRLRDFLDDNKRKYLENLMLQTDKNIQEACRISGLSRSSLYDYLKKYKII
jgi:two-component system NtrC family response regulator